MPGDVTVAEPKLAQVMEVLLTEIQVFVPMATLSDNVGGTPHPLEKTVQLKTPVEFVTTADVVTGGVMPGPLHE